MSFAELAAGSTLAQGCWLVVSRGPCLPGREVGTPPQVVGHPFWKRGLCSFWCTARSAILRDILCPEEWAASLASVPARHQQHPPHVPWGTSVGFQTRFGSKCRRVEGAQMSPQGHLLAAALASQPAPAGGPPAALGTAVRGGHRQPSGRPVPRPLWLLVSHGVSAVPGEQQQGDLGTERK